MPAVNELYKSTDMVIPLRHSQDKNIQFVCKCIYDQIKDKRLSDSSPTEQTMASSNESS